MSTHRARKRVEIIHQDLHDDSPKEFVESGAWAVLKCGCAVVAAIVLALIVLSFQRVKQPVLQYQANTVQELLAHQKILPAENAFSRNSVVGAHQLRLQSADIAPVIQPTQAPNAVRQVVQPVIKPVLLPTSDDFSDATEIVPSPPPAKRVLWSTRLANGDVFQVIDEFIPADCMPQPNTDYDGPAVRWGLHPAPKVRSAAACCQMCKDWKPNPLPCNAWVFCPDTSGECWSADIWNHTTGECWLKYQKDWDENPIIANSNIQVVRKGKFPQAYRDHHKTAPETVPWISGSIIGTKGRF